MNNIDVTDTDGRPNKGTGGLIGLLTLNGGNFEETWLKERNGGTSYCGFVGADYSSSETAIASLFITDEVSQAF